MGVVTGSLLTSHALNENDTRCIPTRTAKKHNIYMDLSVELPGEGVARVSVSFPAVIALS